MFLFVDGIGLGRDDPATNPFAAANVTRLAPLAGRSPVDGAALSPLDATLGVPGLPQSATGQTTLLTGVNAARHAGRHITGVPGPSLRPLLAERSFLGTAHRAGRRVTFANAYTRAHLEAERPRWSATTRAALGAGLRLRMLDEEGRRGEALFHDFDGSWTRARRGPDVPHHTADAAAEILAHLLEGHDLVAYEYFLTDLAGHRGDWQARMEQARRVEGLVEAVLGRAADRHLVLLVSDHGNLERGDHDRHTLNPVPFLAWGPGAGTALAGCGSLTDVAAAVLRPLGL